QFAAKSLKLDLTIDRREQLVRSHAELKTWPDVIPALTKLKTKNIRLAFLSNLTPNMLAGCIRSARLDDVFEQVLSTAAARSYKPDPKAYHLGVDALGLPKEQILFVAFAGWDAAGAVSFGYPTFGVNRLGLPPEELGALPNATGSSLNDLLTFIG